MVISALVVYCGCFCYCKDMNPTIYDLIIIGTGPAGFTASIYASCFHLKHLVIGAVLGGQLQLAPDVLNYPGFEEITGKELAKKLVEQVKKRGGEVVTQSVTKISKSKIQITNQIQNQNDQIKEIFELETQDGKKYQAKAIILATGTERRKLNVPGEVEYTGRGVRYCATCERIDYEREVCGVVGGGNSAVQAAVELAQAAARVYIIYRGTQLRGDPIWLEQVGKNSKIEVIYNTVVTEIVGDGEKVTGVRLQTTDNRQQITNNPSNSLLLPDADGQVLPLDKLFIEIGGVPGTALVIPLGVEMDPGGYIKVNARLATNVPGIFAAGDLVSYGLSIEQISSAVGLGARAAASAFAYVKQEKAPSVWGKSQIRR